jgi:hypothetical protein
MNEMMFCPTCKVTYLPLAPHSCAGWNGQRPATPADIEAVAQSLGLEHAAQIRELALRQDELKRRLSAVEERCTSLHDRLVAAGMRHEELAQLTLRAFATVEKEKADKPFQPTAAAAFATVEKEKAEDGDGPAIMVGASPEEIAAELAPWSEQVPPSPTEDR